MPHHPAAPTGAALHVIAVYHNLDSRFLPYQPGHRLTQVISCWRHLTTVTAVEVADWAYHVFNADLDQLEVNRARPGGETDFLTACVYRLLRLRSLSTGDVVAVTTEGHTTWLACAPVGWHPIDSPTQLSGSPLTARHIYDRLWSKP